MEKFYINGKNPLNGKIKISGSKNSILSILSVSLLSNENIIIKNVPNINDVLITIKILKNIGSKIEFYNSTVYLQNKYIQAEGKCLHDPQQENILRKNSSLIFAPVGKKHLVK